MSLYNNKEIEEMNFEELRTEVSNMRSELTKYKRLLDLFSEDIENSAIGKTISLENGKLKTKIKAVAGKISTKVEDVEKKLSTQITQNAKSITAVAKDADEKIAELELNAEGLRSYVAKAAKLSKSEEVSAKKYMTDTDKIYVIRDRDDDDNIISEAYYYYDIASADWELANEETIYTVFEQYGNGFRLKGNVRVSGDLISEGTIDGSRIQSKVLGDGSTAIACLDKGYIYLLASCDDDDELAKFRVGMYEAGGTYYPYMLFGAGSGSGGADFGGSSAPYINGTMLFEKDSGGFVVSYKSSDGTINAIRFNDSNMGSSSNTIDFGGASVTGLRVTFG